MRSNSYSKSLLLLTKSSRHLSTYFNCWPAWRGQPDKQTQTHNIVLHLRHSKLKCFNDSLHIPPFTFKDIASNSEGKVQPTEFLHENFRVCSMEPLLLAEKTCCPFNVFGLINPISVLAICTGHLPAAVANRPENALNDNVKVFDINRQNGPLLAQCQA